MLNCATLLCLGALCIVRVRPQVTNIRLGQIEDKSWPTVYTPAFLMAIEKFLEDVGPFRSSYNISSTSDKYVNQIDFVGEFEPLNMRCLCLYNTLKMMSGYRRQRGTIKSVRSHGQIGGTAWDVSSSGFGHFMQRKTPE
ncbi:hypothetical protein CAPTEDRAFT_187542 [Capitella teleta]|uniref:Uncharacterized protein n=1 Tax=Capitella teleta TaxID=283909 RepID=R7UDM7_CAPTE|nr:hypothetical protein CAPTEDRAFT_187542 [Capitella teleta]|eukprot:ELU04089.1 hypothetical protein CAPTEDRAFT_187542 [Capitella teleta]